MTTFQLATLPLLLVIIIITAVATARRRVAPRVGLAWMVFWLAAAVFITFPDLLVEIARFLGIGRGADLVFYVAILVTFVAFFYIYLRFRRLDDQITAIVRHLALTEANRTESTGEESRAPRAPKV